MLFPSCFAYFIGFYFGGYSTSSFCPALVSASKPPLLKKKKRSPKNVSIPERRSKKVNSSLNRSATFVSLSVVTAGFYPPAQLGCVLSRLFVFDWFISTYLKNNE